MTNEEYDQYFDPPEDYGYAIDDNFLAAQEGIKALYETNKEAVFYIRQLQVKFEKRYFHWITNNAAIQLFKFGYLKDVRLERERGTSTRYFIHKSNRYPKREIVRMERIIQKYSAENITKSCGQRAEDLFCKALAKRGFMPVAEKVTEFNGKKWTATGHNLDFMFERDGVAYGCEIKNTLPYIDKEELDIKLKMCNHFSVRPLFIMRYSPKTYNKIVIDAKGYVMIFETQIYDLSQTALVDEIKDVIGLPVICSRAIPEGIIDRFEKWHLRHKV